MCPPPVDLGSSAQSLITPCNADNEGCFGYILGESTFYRCESGEWVEVGGIPGL